MQDDKLKQEFTAKEIMFLCRFSSPTFYEYRNAGKIPEPDKFKYKPFIWYRYKILPFIEKYRENNPDKIYPPLP